MSSGGYGAGSDISDAFQNFLNGCAKFVMILGGLAGFVAAGLLVFTASQAGGLAGSQPEAALRNIELFSKILSVGVLGAGVGASYLYWGEELLSGLQLILAGAMYFAPLFLPGLLGSGAGTPVAAAAMGALQQGGMIYGILALVVTIIDIAVRVQGRVKTGVKADQLKYGKGVKEENDKQNVFMGKCWQLPYCRKFVRERCPIYHSKRTCWKELVGCMCEEQVIRNAMENKPIPKDALLAGKMIPQNNRLTITQKRERCKTCVIYNEHQRHKYKLTMPVIVGGFILVYALFRTPLLAMVEGLTISINKIVQAGTLGAAGKYTPPATFVEMLLAVFFVIALTYSMKLAEYLIFKLKV